ncbi:hypothetical protein ANAPC5_01456 [Anaplasma phagocytophilum]|nr:hypothetical protein ANAPC5_01456 [Anaplasma phagocytophilum]
MRLTFKVELHGTNYATNNGRTSPDGKLALRATHCAHETCRVKAAGQNSSIFSQHTRAMELLAFSEIGPLLKPLHVSKAAEGASMHEASATCSPWEDHGGAAQH